MAKAIFRDGRTSALGVVGGVTLLATLAGEYLMHNPAQAQDWHACLVGGCRNNSAEVSELPLPATSVTLLNGSTLNFTIYQLIVLTLGALILVSALVCVVRTTRVQRIVLAAAAVLLALTLVFFRAQAPMQSLVSALPACDTEGHCSSQQPRVISYVPTHVPAKTGHDSISVPLIDSVWFMVPAGALGLLSAGIALLPAPRRRAMS